MTMSYVPEPSSQDLRLAIVLDAHEDRCRVVDSSGVSDVGYATAFPRPRKDRVAPGNLVAIAFDADGTALIVWRWFDAVVTDLRGGHVTLWEPFHGTIQAQPRDPDRGFVLGSRVYASAGLPGAGWWIAGPAVAEVADADVDDDHVVEFFTAHGLWSRISTEP